MQITVVLNSCTNCRHSGHSGAFTKGGAKPVCEHSDAADTATKGMSFKDPDEKYHWKYRVIDKKFLVSGQPEWCPLKHGYMY